MTRLLTQSVRFFRRKIDFPYWFCKFFTVSVANTVDLDWEIKLRFYEDNLYVPIICSPGQCFWTFLLCRHLFPDDYHSQPCLFIGQKCKHIWSVHFQHLFSDLTFCTWLWMPSRSYFGHSMPSMRFYHLIFQISEFYSVCYNNTVISNLLNIPVATTFLTLWTFFTGTIFIGSSLDGGI